MRDFLIDIGKTFVYLFTNASGITPKNDINYYVLGMLIFITLCILLASCLIGLLFACKNKK